MKCVYLILFFLMSSAFSEENKSFNLEEKDCTEFKVDTSNMPKNNNQGPLDWCFAFTSADLLSFHEKVRLSAYDLAVNYHGNGIQQFSETDYTAIGGFSSSAIEAASLSRRGICLEDEVNYTGGDWEKLSRMIKKLGTPGKNFSEIICENQFGEKDIFANLSQDVVSSLDKLAAIKRVEGVFDLQCKKPHKILKQYEMDGMFTKHPVARFNHPKEEIINGLDEVLAKGEPVLIAYASDLLLKGVDFQGESDHASTLIGRKFNPTNGQCEYLIKNSWGSKDCQKTSSIRCEDGNYWVPRTALRNNINSALWIKAD